MCRVSTRAKRSPIILPTATPLPISAKHNYLMAKAKSLAAAESGVAKMSAGGLGCPEANVNNGRSVVFVRPPLALFLFLRRRFLEREPLITSHKFEFLNCARRPMYFERNLAFFSQSEVQPRVAATGVAHAG